MIDPGEFAAVAITLYAAHHVGDYWVQTDHQAKHKGEAGAVGQGACYAHVLGYVITQYVLLSLLFIVTPFQGGWGAVAGLAVSSITHYMADRREHGFMFWLARKLGKGNFMAFGSGFTTGAWALDQAWHIFWGVFVAALLAVSF